MTMWTLVARNVRRNQLRTILTVVAVAVGVVAFVLLRTVLTAWSAGSEYAAKDRLSTRHRISFGTPLPKRYIDDILASVPGVKSATYCDWFGGRWSKHPEEFFANMACADNAFEVYPEITIDPAALAKWKADKQGAIVGDMLARKFGLHVGDRVTLEGSLYPGDWELTIDGIYTAPRESTVDRSTFFFRWVYMNEGVQPWQKDAIGWIFTRVDDPSKSAAVSRTIDALFEDRDVQTTTMSERTSNDALLGGVSAILDALDVVSVIVLSILTLVLGNTIAMGVRERTTEYAVLRALGFEPRHLRALVVGEALAVSLVAALVGLALAFPLVQLGLGASLEENMGKFFPSFRIARGTMVAAVGLTLLGGAVSSLLPAIKVGRMSVTEALRRVA